MAHHSIRTSELLTTIQILVYLSKGSITCTAALSRKKLCILEINQIVVLKVKGIYPKMKIVHFIESIDSDGVALHELPQLDIHY